MRGGHGNTQPHGAVLLSERLGVILKDSEHLNSPQRKKKRKKMLRPGMFWITGGIQLGWQFLPIQSIFLPLLALKEQCHTEPASTCISSYG